MTRVFSRDPPDSPRGGLLADDMGLGKTLTVISLIMHGMRERRAAIGFGKVHASNMTGPTLVVSPLTVLQQWIDQFAKHTDGSARIYVYHGPGRTRHPLSLMLYDVVLTTYSTLGSEFVPEGKRALDDAASVLHCVPWSRVVLDEAPLIANRNALQSRAAVELPGETRWAITGTPVQNRLEDLFSIFAFLRIQPLDEFAVMAASPSRASPRRASPQKPETRPVSAPLLAPAGVSAVGARPTTRSRSHRPCPHPPDSTCVFFAAN